MCLIIFQISNGIRSSHRRWRNLRSCDDMHSVQYLRVFVCLCFCLLVWFARGVCVLPNIYCHNDVWLLREQGFHSREKRGWVDNRLGLPLCLCLNAQQIHIHALNMHTITHTFVCNLCLFGLHTLTKTLIFGGCNANRGQMVIAKKGFS